jgi:hypothetical protein
MFMVLRKPVTEFALSIKIRISGFFYYYSDNSLMNDRAANVVIACPECDRQFNQNSALRRHIKVCAFSFPQLEFPFF